jgi:hypothetical protein
VRQSDPNSVRVRTCFAVDFKRDHDVEDVEDTDEVKNNEGLKERERD